MNITPQHGADHRDVGGHPQGLQDGLPLAPQVAIGVAGEGPGGDEDLVALRTDDVVVRNGNDENENNGQEAGQCQDQEHQVEQEVRCGLDPVQAAEICEANGATSITAHLREDRRHIMDSDIRNFKKVIKTRLNLEMAVTEEMQKIALEVRPYSVCLVPEKDRK